MPSSNRVRPGRRLLATVSAVGLVTVCGVAQATLATGASASVSGAKLTGATHSSLTITVTGHASRFRVYVAKVHHQLIAADLHNDPSSGWSKSHTLTVTGLKYSTTPYFFRVLAESGRRHAYSATFGPVGLRPSAPTGLAVGHPFGAVSLSWSGGTGTGYVVERASNADFTASTKSYSLTGPDQQFSPGDLTRGASYFFRVRAVNTGTRSVPSNAVSDGPTAASDAITAMTYNLHEADISAPSGESWSDRRSKVAAVINTAHPTVVALQEAASWIGAVKGPRQVDDLVSALGGSYKLARTEVPPSEPHYFRTADYILYDPNVVSAVGDGDHWDLGNASSGADHWAAYQEFKVTSTGAKFVFASFHLHEQNKAPASDDQIRQDQAASMLRQGSAYAARLSAPIFYAGDTNSVVESKHKFDGPRVAMQGEHVADAFDVAQSRAGTKYDSANNFERKAPAHRKYIDGVFVPPGVGATAWKQIVDLSHGRFVGVIPSDHNPIVATIEIPY
ncbi:MAG TPA: endonuclease/exonuclease/phosphatase family protein [Mycobacteriales bacterium]|jgi:endonuclease/exonuclease/phosphatase family metal-dependent hydrolase|nr:endonuclease/exonuclease/phosphatase family protein [Mycobacteriales bacterium]